MFFRKEKSKPNWENFFARLYTDDGGENNTKQQAFQENTFKPSRCRFMRFWTATAKPIATFPGLTRNTQEFVDFLQKAEKN